MNQYLILSPRFSEDTRLMRQAALSLGWRVERARHWRLPEAAQGAVAAIYGEDSFVQVVADQENLTLLKPKDDWLATLPLKYLQRKVEYTTIELAKSRQHSFIKPVDYKFFTAGVYASGQEIPGVDSLNDDVEVYISEVVDFEFEMRAFVCNREIKSASIYAHRGELDIRAEGEELSEGRQFLATMLADQDVSLPVAVVIDVGRLQDGRWAVIEANPAWGSGLYACDPVESLKVVAAACCR